MIPDPKTAAADSSRVEEPAAAYDPAVAGVRAARRLADAGFERRQADAVVLAVRDLVGELATKTDLAIAEGELRAEIAEVKGELKAGLDSVKKDAEHIKAAVAALATRESVSRIDEILPTLSTKGALELVKKDVERIKDTMATKDALELVKKDVERIKDTMATKADLDSATMATEAALDSVKKDIEHIKETMATKADLDSATMVAKAGLDSATMVAKAGLDSANRDIEHIKATMATKTDIAEVRADILSAEKRLITWFISTALVLAGTVIAATALLIRLPGASS